MSDPGPCPNRENGHSWYTTKRRIDEDITFCWKCGLGWVPDNGLLVDSEIDWPEPVKWMTGMVVIDDTTDAITYARLDRNQEVAWLLAVRAGLEPATVALTGRHSAIELPDKGG